MRSWLQLLFFLRLCFAEFNYNEYKYGEYTLIVMPRQVECVYMDVTADDKSFEIAYQVVEGGELDISLIVYRPDHSVQESETRKMEGGVTVVVQHVGEYRICFDNSYSMVSKKVVYFEVFPSDTDQDDSVEQPGAGQHGDAGSQKHAEAASQKQHVSESGNQAAEKPAEEGEKAPEINLDEKDDDADTKSTSPESVTKHVAKGLVRMNKYLTYVVQTLNYYKNIESRDRSVGEANFERVNSFSIIEIVTIVTVSVIQVVIVRAMLDPKSRVRQLVTKLLAKH